MEGATYQYIKPKQSGEMILTKFPRANKAEWGNYFD